MVTPGRALPPHMRLDVSPIPPVPEDVLPSLEEEKEPIVLTEVDEKNTLLPQLFNHAAQCNAAAHTHRKSDRKGRDSAQAWGEQEVTEKQIEPRTGVRTVMHIPRETPPEEN